jgi:TRAP-type mannitol/chloroaromatic compound transport system substrate-binding protein
MKRRDFLKKSGAAAAGVASAALAAPAISQDRKQWRLITTWPKNLPGLGTGAQYFADQVTACSDGRLEVKLYASGEVVPAFESIDAVSAGTVEMGHGAPYYWKGKSVASQLVSNFPFGLTAQEYNAWYQYGGGAQLCDELYQNELGCRFILCGNTGVQHPGYSSKELNTLEDFQGLKMRMPGIGGAAMSAVGATVINLPGSEVAQAFASGTVDWVEWNNPYGEAAMGFHRYGKYYYTPGFHEPNTSLDLFINPTAWASLSSDLQAIVRQCAYSTTHNILAEFTAYSAPQLQNLVQNEGVIIKVIPDDALIALGNAAGEIIADQMANDPSSAKIFPHMVKFRNEQIPYSNTTEGEFMRARQLPYSFPS